MPRNRRKRTDSNVIYDKILARKNRHVTCQERCKRGGLAVAHSVVALFKALWAGILMLFSLIGSIFSNMMPEKKKRITKKVKKVKKRKKKRKKSTIEPERGNEDDVDHNRIEREQLEIERRKQRAAEERLEVQRLERERVLKKIEEEVERQRLEKRQRQEQKRQRLEAERLEASRVEREEAEKTRLRIQNQRLEKERIQRERVRKEQMRKEALRREQLERERLERERQEFERLERERIERERLEFERLEYERLENERIQKQLMQRRCRAAMKVAVHVAKTAAESVQEAVKNMETCIRVEKEQRMRKKKSSLEQAEEEMRVRGVRARSARISFHCVTHLFSTRNPTLEYKLDFDEHRYSRMQDVGQVSCVRVR